MAHCLHPSPRCNVLCHEILLLLLLLPGLVCDPANVAVTASPIGPVSTGMNVTLNCSADDPTGSDLTYVWLRNGVRIHQVISPILTLIRVGPEDGGTYTCRVSNRVGLRVASATVEVIGKVVGSWYMCMNVYVHVCVIIYWCIHL